MTQHSTRILNNLAVQLVAGSLVLLLLRQHHQLTYELALKITPGMAEREVEALLGKSQTQDGYKIVLTVSDSRTPPITDLTIATSYPQGHGEQSYWLRASIDCDSSATAFSRDSGGIWLSDKWSVLVTYNRSRCVHAVYICPTTYDPGDWWERMKWRVKHWWLK